jgi:hypothetical protein
MKVYDGDSPAGDPNNPNDPSQTEREEKISKIYDGLLLLEGYAAVRRVAFAMWILVIFQVSLPFLLHLQIIKPSPFIDACRVWLPVVGCLGVVIYSIYLFFRGIPFKPVRQCLIIALALLGNAVLNYYHEYLVEFMRIIVGLQFGGK